MPDTPDPGLTSGHDRGRASRPLAWGDAFAALEMETPPGDGWPRMAAMLPMAPAPSPTARPAGERPRARYGHGRRRLAWLAAAAALALAVGIPFLSRKGPSEATSAAARTVAQTPRSPARAIAPIEPVAAAVDTGGIAPRTDPADDGSLREASDGARAIATRMSPASAAGSTDVAAVAREPRVALETGVARVARTGNGAPSLPTGTTFDRLYAESARLEAMVALARDDGMSSAAAATMTAAIDARIGGIDASLSQPDLLPDARLQLWEARVGALRDLAGLETTQRLMASQGRDYEATLVRVD